MTKIYRYLAFVALLFNMSAAYAATCQVNYSINNDWGNGFTTSVVLTNQGEAWSGWEATWTMPSGQRITGLWNGRHTQNGADINVKSYSWNANVATGGSVQFGFNGSYSGKNELPYDITVNGERCSGQPDAPSDDGNGDDANDEDEKENIVCEANYAIRTQWNTGFTTDVTIKNQGDALNGWTVTWTMPLAQRVTHGWNGIFAQNDDKVTVTPANWNKNISSDGVISFGFNGAYNAENPIPIDLAVNGVQCAGQPDSVAVSPKAPTTLTAVMVDNTNAVLIWQDNSDNEERFIIERRQTTPANQNWQSLQQTNADITRYEDTALAIGTSYEYRLKANNATADSDYSNVANATRQDHTQIGKQMLADNCANCHGSDGNSTVSDAIPTIAGLSRDYIINTMAAYQNDERASTIMGRVARGYSTEQVALIADALAAQNYIAAQQTTDTQLVQLGRKIHDENCGACHTDNGRSLLTGSPLAGQWKTYLTATLLDYQENTPARVPNAMMVQVNSLTSKYGVNALAAIVDFYAANPDDSTGYDNTDTGDGTDDTGDGNGSDDSGDAGDSGDDSTNNGDGNGDNNNATTPTSPTGLSATVSANERVNLSWIDSSNNETGFKVERKTANGDWLELATLVANSSSYQDNDVSVAQQYAYRISAYNANGANLSSEASASLLSILDYGKQQYTSQGCATCHGATGTGGITNKPLTGYSTADLASLTQINTTTMPPSNPAACVGNCAASIAQYIIDVLATDDAGDESGNPQACSGVEPASTRSLRLLTRYEYQNTVNDLLGLSVNIIHELPDENRVLGFDNNIDANQVTALRLEAFLNKAEDLAAQAVNERFGTLVPCQTTDNNCATQFITSFGKNAYRRPLTDAETTRYLSFFAQDSFSSAVEKTIMAMLSSPHMLYRSELGTLQADGSYQLTAYEIASSLSYLFWGSMPDAELMQLADANALNTDAQRLAQALRLLNDAKSREQVGNFVGQWLLASNPYSLPEKDASVYPSYTNDVRSSLSQELVNFFNHVAFNSSQQYSELFNSNYVLANNVLANFYGLPTQNGSEFAVTPVTDNTRTGILTLGAVLAKYANSNESHPFKRGAFVFERLLCHELPEAANMGMIATPTVDPNATTRERFAFHSESDASCFSCHQYIDGPGFGLEGYDGAGQFRATENGQAVDTTGILRGLETYTAAEQFAFDNPKQLSSVIAQSPNAAQCVAKQYYRYTVGREETSADSCAMNSFIDTYKASDYNLQTMLLGIVNAPNFIKRQAK